MTDDQDYPILRAQSLHRDVREELVRADSKATTLLSVVGIILGALVAGAISGKWTPQKIDNSFEWLFWIAVVLAIAGEASLLLAVLPRVKHDQDTPQPRYFGDVVRRRDRDELRKCLDAADSPYEQALDQVWVISAIVDRKYRHVSWGLKLFAAAVVLGPLALLLARLCR